MFLSIPGTRKASLPFLETVLPEQHQLLELPFIQLCHMRDELLAPDASCLVETKACVLCEGIVGFTVRRIDGQCDLGLRWPPSA